MHACMLNEVLLEGQSCNVNHGLSRFQSKNTRYEILHSITYYTKVILSLRLKRIEILISAGDTSRVGVAKTSAVRRFNGPSFKVEGEPRWIFPTNFIGASSHVRSMVLFVKKLPSNEASPRQVIPVAPYKTQLRILTKFRRT